MTVELPTCSPLPAVPAPLSVRLPGGISLVASPITAGLIVTPLVQAQSMISALGPALAGLAPALTLIEAVVAIMDTVKAIPGLVVGDVEGFASALERAVNAVAKLVGMAPQLSLPVAIADTLRVLGVALRATADALESVNAAGVEAAALVARAQAEGDANLEAVGRCLEAQSTALAGHALASLGGAGALLSTMGNLAQMVPGLPALPTLDGLTGLPLDEVITMLRTIAGVLEALPIPGG